jgi:hypothetical protein
LRATPKTSRRRLVQQALTVAIGCVALAWGIYTLPSSEAADDLRDIEARLLRFETFSRTILAETLASQAALSLDACDTHSQRAMLLMEMPLAQAALRSGTVDEFDQHIQSLELRAKRLLSCAPRDSFVWLLLFNLEVLHGQLNQPSFDLLAMSYETSPNEAWISIRRIFVAMPLVAMAPEPLRQKILFEFQQLIRHGFEGEAARCYSTASEPVRLLLRAQLEQLDPPRQKAFADALQKLGT